MWGGAHEEDVVVDGLWDADDSTHDVLMHAHLVDRVGSGVATVAADNEEHVHAPHVETLDDLADVGTATARAEDGAALQLDAVHRLRSQHQRLDVRVVEPLKAVPAGPHA